jgi:(p)ppGpp synthase/HD superfamily hydrolase
VAQPTPDFVAGSDRLELAFSLAHRAHSGPDSGTEIEHPVAVACLLAEAGFDEDVIAAALLHDVVEDTGDGLSEIRERFGGAVADLVEVMTEDDSIEDYHERKDEHRRRVLDDGPVSAAMYAADKLARVRRYHEAGEPVAPHRLDHYRETLRLYSGARPELPFLEEIAAKLPELERAG